METQSQAGRHKRQDDATMDTTTWSGRAKSVPVMQMERIIAWSFVAIAHLLLAWFATRISVPRPLSGRPMELVFIQLPASPSPMRAAARKQKTVSGPRMAARFKVRPSLAIAAESASERMPAPTLQETTADDRWDTPASANNGDSSLSAGNNPMHRVNPIQMGPPERFRMRKQLSPADIVRIISMGLLWPPGYTDDPCPGLDKAVQMLTGASTRRERKILEDAVKEQERYCS